MAITQVQAAQSAGSGNNTAVTLSATTSGNLIVSCFSQSNTNTPSAVCGAQSLTIHATKALFNGSVGSVWIGYCIAPAGATSVTWTPGTSATGHGVCAWEFAGAANPVQLDFATAVHTDNISAATGSTPTVTTTTAGSVVCIGVGGNVSSGTISAWTGTNVATNIGTSTARCFGGRFITTSTISSAFTANWATSRVCGMIALAFKPASTNQNVSVSGLGSAQAFGAITANMKISVGGLGSAQAFGTPTAALGGSGQVVSVTGLGSAKAFGTVTPSPGGVIVPVTGLGSAASFGTLKANQIIHMNGLGSAQAFGTITPIPGGVTVPVSGLGSAQAFGGLNVTTPSGASFGPELMQRRRYAGRFNSL